MNVKETKTITIDDKVYATEHFNEELKRLVMFMDEWRQKEVDTEIELVMIKSALRDVQNTIYAAVKQAEAEAAAQEETKVEAPAAE